MKKLIALTLVTLGVAVSARAQWIVYDPTMNMQQIMAQAQNIAKYIQMIQNQVQQIQTLTDQLNEFKHYEDLFGDPKAVLLSTVQPLVNELNALLSDREERVTRALTKAGDLAHGLKTPLTLLNQQAERAKAEGQGALAAAIAQQVGRMRRQIDYHLAHARASASGADPTARCHALTSADALARTMATIHAERHLAIDVHVPHDTFVRGRREDFEEMLGNLVDNACKWATRRIEVRSGSDNGHIVTTVDDDGPGLDPSLRESVLKRGVRADEAAPGSGLGLAIVADLVELYGGSIALGSSPLGGLRATLKLPSA